MALENLTSQKVYAGLLGNQVSKVFVVGRWPDVIFAGTESRKPLKLCFLLVVTLDNQDGFIKDAGQKIKVERHIYRTGDSEYKIDGKKSVFVIFMIFS